MTLFICTSLFPLWAVAVACAAWLWPGPFVSARPAIVPLLGVIMLSMGMTLQWRDFVRVAERPVVIVAGVLLQFFFMPLAAWVISCLMHLGPALLVGMVLVGACPGGTASNVICYLAGGDVALSICLTTCSTILSVVATPFFTWLYAGHTVPVPVLSMFISILEIVLIPVTAGVVINTLAGPRLHAIKEALPLLSVGSIVFIIGIVVGLNHENLRYVGPAVAVAVVLHNLSGLGAGYLLPMLAGWDRRICRTLAIEVGMQNSGLAVALTLKYFSVTAALPGAVFSLWHNLSGSMLASFLSWVDRKERA